MDPHAMHSKSQSPSIPEQVENMKTILYWEAIGSLMWAAVTTRLDIAFSVSILSQFMESWSATLGSSEKSFQIFEKDKEYEAHFWTRKNWIRRVY